MAKKINGYAPEEINLAIRKNIAERKLESLRNAMEKKYLSKIRMIHSKPGELETMLKDLEVEFPGETEEKLMWVLYQRNTLDSQSQKNKMLDLQVMIFEKLKELDAFSKMTIVPLPKIYEYMNYETQKDTYFMKGKEITIWELFLDEFSKMCQIRKINGILKNFETNEIITKEGLYEMIAKNIFNTDKSLDKQIFEKLVDSLPNKYLQTSKYWIVFNNCKVNIKTMEVVYGQFESANIIPHNYNPDAESDYGRELMDRYIGTNIGFDTQIFEAMGLMMTQSRDLGLKVAIFANGDADFGKNFLFDYMIAPAIGKHNIGAFSLGRVDNLTERVSFIHKTAAYDQESINSKMTAAQLRSFKEITGGDTLPAKILYKDIFTFENYATVWMNCNGIPDIKDQGSGGAAETRIHLIQFTVPVKKKYRDPEIYDKVEKYSNEISEWMIAESIKAIHNVLKTGELTVTEISRMKLDTELYVDDVFHRWAEFFFGGNGHVGLWDKSPIKLNDLYILFLETFKDTIVGTSYDKKYLGLAGINYGSNPKHFSMKWFRKNIQDQQVKYNYDHRETYKDPKGTQTRQWVLPIKGGV